MVEEQKSNCRLAMGSVMWPLRKTNEVDSFIRLLTVEPRLSLLGLLGQPAPARIHAMRHSVPHIQSACIHSDNGWQPTQRIRGNAETCMSSHSHAR